jgi:hypothetical protein
MYIPEGEKHTLKGGKVMKNTRFGIEIEFTGITRAKAAESVSKFLNGNIQCTNNSYDCRKITAPDGRVWQVMSDASVRPEKKENGRTQSAGDTYKVELVSPILTYEGDIQTLQEMVRHLRKAGAFTNSTCGIHIHLDGENHNPRSIKNFINIIASKNDLFYKALEIEPERMRFCKKMDESLVNTINHKKPKTMDAIEKIWYSGYNESRDRHYHSSRYHFLNLHSFFTENHTVELRGFNSTMHAGEIRSYIILALALNKQALTQKSASSRKNQTENEKFAMRTYLNRIGLIGDEFKNCREHLCKALSGSAAWRFRIAA